MCHLKTTGAYMYNKRNSVVRKTLFNIPCANRKLTGISFKGSIHPNYKEKTTTK